MDRRFSVAVVPFGAVAPARADDGGSGARHQGAWARQIARRLVDRFAAEPEIELRPVFLVVMPEAASDAGYLVFGSTPDPTLAASYGRSLGTTHALVGTYRESEGGRRLEATLVEVASGQAAGTFAREIPPGELHLAEPALATWLARTLGVGATQDLAAPATSNEAADAALLEAMDAEVDATLLRTSDATAADDAEGRAASRYVDAIRADATSAVAEERVLVLAAAAIERGEPARHVPTLEEVTTIRPRSWRAHYLLAELRRLAGDVSGAIVAFEHADALHPLRDADVLTLARLYAQTHATSSAVARLRRIEPQSDRYVPAQELLGFLTASVGDLEASTAAFERALAAGGGLGVRLVHARALIETGERERALAQLRAILEEDAEPAVAAGARRLRLGVLHPDVERGLEEAGQIAVTGEEDRLGAAAELLRRALEVEPELWEAHFGLGLLARRLGDPTEAERAFRRVLEIYPDQADAMHELGVALVAGGRPDDALPLLVRATEMRPDDPGYLADEGYARLRTGDVAGAGERIRRASRLDPDDPLTRAYLAELERLEIEAGRPN